MNDVKYDHSSEDLETHFDFSAYLEPLLGHVLAEFVEIPSMTWLILEGILIVAWQISLHVPTEVLGVLYLLFGFMLPVIVRVTHGKLRSIKADVCLVSGQLHDLYIEKELSRISPGNSFRAESEKTVLLNAPMDNSGAIESSARPTKTGSAISAFVLPVRYDPESLSDHYGHSNFPSDQHHTRFWLGAKYRREFMQGLLRKSVLLNSIYLAVMVLMFLPAVFADTERGVVVNSIILIVTLIPPVLLLYLLPDAIQDFVLTTSILNMKNKRVLENAIRRMKTRQCFLTLKIIYMMTCQVQRKDKSKTETKQETNMPSLAHSRRGQVWKKIFDMIDEDHSGSVSQDELLTHLRKMVPNLEESHIIRVMNELDEDGSGDIDFEEFMRYAAYVSGEAEEDLSREEIVKGMFELVLSDQTNRSYEPEPTLTIRELQHALAKLGQDLSADDVYNVIKDIDENGDGQLCLEEFGELLGVLEVIKEE